MSDKKSKIAKLLNLKKSIKPETNSDERKLSSPPPPRWKKQVKQVADKKSNKNTKSGSGLNVNAQPFISSGIPTPSPSNNKDTATKNKENKLNFNNIWDFKCALDESHSDPYLDDTFSHKRAGSEPFQHEKMRNLLDTAQLSTIVAISFADLKLNKCSLSDLNHHIAQIRDFMMQLLTKKTIQNNNKIIAELGKILHIYQQWIDYKNMRMRAPQEKHANMDRSHMDTTDRELIMCLVQEICDEFGHNIDLKRIHNNMANGIYTRFDDIYSDFAQIWRNAKRFEHSVHLKLRRIIGRQRVDALQSNVCTGCGVYVEREFKLNDNETSTQKELDEHDPFAVLDDLIDKHKINNDADGDGAKIEEIINKKKKKKRRRTHKQDFVFEDEKVMNIPIKISDEFRPEMVEIALRNSQQKTKEKVGKHMDDINNKKKQNKNKGNVDINDIVELEANSKKEENENQTKQPQIQKKEDITQLPPEKVKSGQKSPKLNATTKPESNNKQKCDQMPPKQSNDGKRAQISKTTSHKNKKQNKNKSKKKQHKNKGKPKNKGKGKKPKEKNKIAKPNPMTIANDQEIAMERTQTLTKMGVSQLKNTLKLYIQETEFSSFCEKSEFVAEILRFESKMAARKQKWAEFRLQCANINRDIVGKTHKKYAEYHNAAVAAMNLGNAALQNGDHKGAVKHYTESIRLQIDYKPAYTNRSLVYLKQNEYDKCIADCSVIIEMIMIVDDDMLQSNEMFQSYLRRAQAYKLQKKYVLAKCDLGYALKIKPNDLSARKLLIDTKAMSKKSALRKQLYSVTSLNDFNSVLNLSVELLQHATRENKEDSEDLFECNECDELLRRLFVFLYKNKNCCQLFVSENGLILCLKYVRYRFTIGGKKWNSNQGLLGKLYSLLNRCVTCDNIDSNNSELLSLSSTVILFTFKYFDCMSCELQVTAMRFVSLIVSNDFARDYIVSDCGAEIISYFTRFQLKTDPLSQDIASIRCLFESLSFFFRSSIFLQLLLSQNASNGPCFIYVVFLESMCVYVEAIKNMDKEKHISMFKPLQFAISVLLDGLAIIFDGGRTNPLLNESEMELFLHKMTAHFVQNSNTTKKYMILLREYFACTLHAFERSLNNLNGENNYNYNEAILYFSQAGKCQNVLTALSYIPCIDLLFKFNVYPELIYLISLCQSLEHKKNRCLYENPQIQSLFALTRNNILTYFDHISDDYRFDLIFKYFWKYLMHFFVEKYINIKLFNIQQFGHNKSCAIRCVYRWLHRQNKNLCASGYIAENKILVGIIYKYFVQMLDCLSFNDEQVLANAPLVIRECIKYATQQQHKCISSMTNTNYSIDFDLDIIKLIKFVRKALTPEIIKIVIKLMKTKHAAIQYNAMLLVTQISEYDQELHHICNIYGALQILETYDNARKLQNVEILQEPLHFD